MAKRKRKAAAEGDTPGGETGAEGVSSNGSFSKASESWRQERRAYKAIQAACNLLKVVGVANPDNLDKFVERVFRNAGVEL